MTQPDPMREPSPNDTVEASVNATRARFARDFPREPEVDALVSAFESGNYALVRLEGQKLAASTKSDAVREAAHELIARTDADPLARVLIAVTGALLFFLTAWWLSNGHISEASASPPPPPAVERIN